MQRVRRSTAVAVQPTPPIGVAPGFFTGGSPGSGVPATVPGFEWYNDVQEELVAPILRAGLALDPADQAQLRRALDRLFGGGLRSVTANATLTADDAGLVLVDATAGPITITLPAANAANGRPQALQIIRTDGSAHAVTIQRAGADTIDGATSTTLRARQRLSLQSQGAGAWYVPAASSGWAVFAASGTFTPPPGVVEVEVWGGAAGGGGSAGTANSAASGGGAGGYAAGRVAVTPGQPIAVTVGAGGAGGAGGASPLPGGAGGTSSFGPLISATGGQPGLAADGAVQLSVGPGGAGVGGELQVSGTPGGVAYPVGAGQFISAQGGRAHGGIGTPPQFVGGIATGFGGVSFGDGGSGGALGGPGGAGRNGLVIVRWR